MSAQTQDQSQLILEEAINKLDLPTLRSVFKDMCASSEEIRQQATERLIVTRSAAKKHAAADDDPQEASASNKKQKQGDEDTLQSRFEPCKNCKQVFDVTKNTPTSCQFHDGALGIDDEVFPDDDDVAYHPDGIDVHTDWRREEWPEGFIWNCCEKNCNNKGCIAQKHEAAVTLHGKNGKTIILLDDDDDDDEEEGEEDEYE
ncbi:hypothetical protein PGQ11_001762 [Apiospora arundinis]|uniref:Uncharacterized protein n=1 Tax=Apiospora arundinis TaxID=335852 RepID=A0ABR2JGB5_9PEZI